MLSIQNNNNNINNTDSHHIYQYEKISQLCISWYMYMYISEAWYREYLLYSIEVSFFLSFIDYSRYYFRWCFSLFSSSWYFFLFIFFHHFITSFDAFLRHFHFLLSSFDTPSYDIFRFLSIFRLSDIFIIFDIADTPHIIWHYLDILYFHIY